MSKGKKKKNLAKRRKRRVEKRDKIISTIK